MVAQLVYGVQLWVLLVIPLGVLATGDAAQAGRRGWLAAFVALAVLAADLFNTVTSALIGSGAGSTNGGALPFQHPLPVINVATPVVVMLAALLYALTMRPRQHAPALAGA